MHIVNSPLLNYNFFGFFWFAPSSTSLIWANYQQKLPVRGPCLTTLTWVRALLAIDYRVQSSSSAKATAAECFSAITSTSTVWHTVRCCVHFLWQRKKSPTKSEQCLFFRGKKLYEWKLANGKRTEGAKREDERAKKINTQTSTHSHAMRIYFPPAPDSIVLPFFRNAISFSHSRALSLANSFHIFLWRIPLFSRLFGEHANWILI